jgi:hypothetical protein
MSEFLTSWSKEELKVYLLIYCANADFHETEVETDFIKSKTTVASFDQLHHEFNKDSDFQRIQKIRLTVKRHEYSREQLDDLFEEIKEMFLMHEEYDLLEQNLLRELNHVVGH